MMDRDKYNNFLLLLYWIDRDKYNNFILLLYHLPVSEVDKMEELLVFGLLV